MHIADFFGANFCQKQGKYLKLLLWNEYTKRRLSDEIFKVEVEADVLKSVEFEYVVQSNEFSVFVVSGLSVFRWSTQPQRLMNQ